MSGLPTLPGYFHESALLDKHLHTHTHTHTVSEQEGTLYIWPAGSRDRSQPGYWWCDSIFSAYVLIVKLSNTVQTQADGTHPVWLEEVSLASDTELYVDQPQQVLLRETQTFFPVRDRENGRAGIQLSSFVCE